MTPRFDIYGPIHKALRAVMTDTLLAVGRMDALDEADTTATIARVRALLALARAHLEKEDEFLHPALEACRPGSSAAAARDHAHHEDSLAALEDLAVRVEATPGSARIAEANRLYRGLCIFVAENFEHMHLEETDHNATLWASYSDEQLHAIHDALVQSVDPQEMAEVMRWMVPNTTPIERAGALGDMQRKAPAHVFGGVLELVRPHLAAREWDKLMHALAPLPVAA
ncbi:MAG: hemerythrin domain-containing protein [Gemmatimonadota bacterium]